MVRGRLLAGIMLLALMLVPAASPLVSAINTGSTATAKPGQIDRVRIFINIVNRTIERVLGIAEEYNITIPESLAGNIDDARSLLKQAEAIVEEDPGEAFRLAKEALRTFRPVAIYVASSLEEDVREELVARGLEKAIENQLEHIDRIEDLVKGLEDKGFTVPEEVKAKLERAREILVNASRLVPLVENGTISASRVSTMIGNAKLLVAEALRDLNRRVVLPTLFKTRMLEHQAEALARLITHMNATTDIAIKLVQGNATAEAGEVINATIRMAEKAGGIAARIKTILEAHNITGNATEAMDTIIDGLNNVTALLEEARSLMENDTLAALASLEAASQQLTGLLEEVAPLMGPARHRLEICVEHMHGLAAKIGHAMDAAIVHAQIRLGQGLRAAENKLKHMYRAYMEGRISRKAWERTAISTLKWLEALEEHLERAHLPGTAPLRNMIDQLQSWILSTLTG